MTSSGYSGDESSSSQDATVFSPFRFASTLRNPCTPAGSFPGVNNFLHGMHSFRSADELHFYLQRIGGQGSIVNTTHAIQIDGPVQQNVFSSGLQGVSRAASRCPLQNTVDYDMVNSSSESFSQASTVVSSEGSSGSSESSGSQPVPLGYERNRYIVGCGLHNSTNVAATDYSNISSMPQSDSQQGQTRDVFYFGFCDICRTFTLDNVARGLQLILY